MSAGFTPGPWVAPEGPFVGGHYVHTATCDADICEMPDWPMEHRHEEEANANLIAAAPELYEALEAARCALHGKLLERADAALAKARSEQVQP